MQVPNRRGILGQILGLYIGFGFILNALKKYFAGR